MDQAQNDHLKAYGIAYYSLKKNINVEWVLNYRGGAFLFDENQLIISECKIRGISFEKINTSDLVSLYSAIDQNNMDIVLLEKNPKKVYLIEKDHNLKKILIMSLAKFQKI